MRYTNLLTYLLTYLRDTQKASNNVTLSGLLELSRVIGNMRIVYSLDIVS